MAEYRESPSQTAGPYVHIGCVPSFAGLTGMYGGRDPGATMITGTPEGRRIALDLRVIDGAGEPLRDALVEIWQPGPDGGFGTTPGFANWGRQPSDADTGRLRFDTLEPGAPAGQAPHFLVWIAARGINLALMTRIYLPGTDPASDPVLSMAGARAATMIARAVPEGLAHDIHLQGDNETVFLDV